MKKFSLFEGVIIAALLSATGSLLYLIFTLVFSLHTSAQFSFSIIATLYAGYILARSSKPFGKLSLLTGWAGWVVAIWLINLSLIPFIIAHLLGLWLLRSVTYHSQLLPRVLDLILCAASFIIAFVALTSTNSLAFSLWCLFLTQALFSALPKHWQKKQKETHDNKREARFNQAFNNAESALYKLATKKDL